MLLAQQRPGRDRFNHSLYSYYPAFAHTLLLGQELRICCVAHIACHMGKVSQCVLSECMSKQWQGRFSELYNQTQRNILNKCSVTLTGWPRLKRRAPVISSNIMVCSEEIFKQNLQIP